MSINHEYANAVYNFTNSFYDHPEEISRLIESFEAVNSYDHPAPALEGLDNPDTAVEAVVNVARNLTEAEALATAKSKVIFRIHRELFDALENHLEHYTKPIRARFEKSSKAYQQAVSKLPEGEFTAEDISRFFSTAQVTAYRAAAQAAAELVEITHDVTSLEQSRHGGLVPHQGLYLIFEPTNEEAFNTMESSSVFVGGSTYGAIAPAYRALLAAGAEFKFSTPQEAAQAKSQAFEDYATIEDLV